MLHFVACTVEYKELLRKKNALSTKCSRVFFFNVGCTCNDLEKKFVIGYCIFPLLYCDRNRLIVM